MAPATSDPRPGDPLITPLPMWRSDDQRRLLVEELRTLIAAGRYSVEPGAVAQAIIDESSLLRRTH